MSTVKILMASTSMSTSENSDGEYEYEYGENSDGEYEYKSVLVLVPNLGTGTISVN